MKYEELTPEQTTLFQQRALTTLMELERTFDLLAECDSRNVLIVCDRGSMDPFACEWWNENLIPCFIFTAELLCVCV